MAAITPRFASQALNLAIASATAITGSSQQTSFPLAWLRDAMPSKRWRSQLGWTIVSGFNASIDFNRGGVKVATIAAGFYATGSALGTAIAAALTAADGATTWGCTYDGSTKKFTITGSANFILLFGSGTNIATGAGKDLGFAVADTGSALTQTGGSASYHSREYVLFDLGSAQNVTLGVAHGHNMGSGGTAILYGKASNNPWTSPGTTQTLTGDDLSTKRILFFGVQSFRYWALVIEDVSNTVGFSELGVPFVGTYWEPGRGFQAWPTRQPESISQTMRSAKGGALYVLVRDAPFNHAVTWRGLSRSDRDTYQAIENARGHGFLSKDPTNFPGAETYYVVPAGAAPIEEQTGPGGLYGIQAQFTENLG